MKYLTESLDHWQGEASRLAAENESLRAELEATENLAIKQGEWLQAIVNITKGEPGELKLHSTHDVVGSVQKALAWAKAAGAREALQRARYNKGYSDTVVRVDELLAVIADMEKGDE